MKFASMLLVAGLSALAAAGAARAEVVRHPIPNSTFPIAQAVEVLGNVKTGYVSGQVPPVIDKDADPNSPQAFGDTKTQTVGPPDRIKGRFARLGLALADAVQLQWLLVSSAA